MNELQKLLNAGYDISMHQICGGETYYIYLSDGEHGEDFVYGYGKSLPLAFECLMEKLEAVTAKASA